MKEIMQTEVPQNWTLRLLVLDIFWFYKPNIGVYKQQYQLEWVLIISAQFCGTPRCNRSLIQKSYILIIKKLLIVVPKFIRTTSPFSRVQTNN